MNVTCVFGTFRCCTIRSSFELEQCSVYDIRIFATVFCPSCSEVTTAGETSRRQLHISDTHRTTWRAKQESLKAGLHTYKKCKILKRSWIRREASPVRGSLPAMGGGYYRKSLNKRENKLPNSQQEGIQNSFPFHEQATGFQHCGQQVKQWWLFLLPRLSDSNQFWEAGERLVKKKKKRWRPGNVKAAVSCEHVSIGLTTTAAQRSVACTTV